MELEPPVPDVPVPELPDVPDVFAPLPVEPVPEVVLEPAGSDEVLPPAVEESEPAELPRVPVRQPAEIVQSSAAAIAKNVVRVFFIVRAWSHRGAQSARGLV